MKINRVVFGWTIFAIVLFILALVVVIPAFLAGPAAKLSSAGISHRATSPPSSSPSSAALPAFLTSSFPADDPARDSLPPSILPVVVLKDKNLLFPSELNSRPWRRIYPPVHSGTISPAGPQYQ